MTSRLFLTFCLAASLVLSACDRSKELYSNTVNAYADIVLANYQDTYDGALEMQIKIDAFLAAPSEASLAEAKAAWLAARESYGQTEAFRFYGGPIDDEDGPEGRLNAWPLDESYIDYVANSRGNSTINIINNMDDFPEISAEMIAALNENGGETNISSGYHAIEFLLWGQDLSDGAGAGNRPYTDFVTDEAGTADNQERRRQYLSEVTKLLLSDLSSLVNEWKSGEDDFRVVFTADPATAIEDIVSALGKLSKGELAGERMFVAFDLQSKEDEHSCFSDNTHRDIVNNAIGIRNVFMGTYKRTDGTVVSGASVYEVLASENQELAGEIEELMNQSVASCAAIQPPFDQEFKTKEGRERIATAIKLLRLQGDKLAEAAQALGFQFDPEAI